MWGGKGSKGGGGYGPMSGGDPWSSWGMGGAWSKGAMMQQMAAMMSGPYGWGGMGGMGGMGGGGKGGSRSGSFSTSDDPEKEALVTRVKQVQRAGDEEKEKWWQFCDAQNTGTRDPSRHNVDFLRRFLEAYESGDIHQAMARGGRGATVEKGESNVLRMRGLPFSCKPSQVIDFLADFDLDDSNVVFTSTADGRPSGEAYVLFHSPDDAERAYSEKQHQHLGSRYVEIFRASQDEWSQAKKAMSGGGGGVSRGVRGGGGRTSYPTLRLRGLPFSSGSMDVVNFFSDYGVEKADVVMGIGNDGRPSGEAFVIFRDDNAASRALDEKQNEKMGTRYVEIFASSYDEWTKASNNRGGGGGGGGGGFGMMDPWSMMGFGPWGMGGGMSGWGGGGGGKGGRGGGGGGCSGDPQKDGLVQRVKSIQRSSPDAKEAWWSYCDNDGRGIRDPSRHEEAFLQRFLDQYG